jgi:hypothetical protein
LEISSDRAFFNSQGRPWGKGCIESLYVKICGELLNGEISDTILKLNVAGW